MAAAATSPSTSQQELTAGEVRRAMENGGERKRRIPSELAMCSTCSGFVLRKDRVMDPDEELVEVVTEAAKMRNLIRAVIDVGLHQMKEPAEATMEQWRVLRRRRMLMLETNRCPACSRSVSKKPGPLEDEEDKAAGSKEEKKKAKKARRSKEEKKDKAAGSKEEDKTAASKEEEDKAAGSKEEKKKAKKARRSKEGSGSNKKARRSIETEGSGSKGAEMEDTESREEVKMGISESAGRNGKTKMVTMKVYKKSIDIFRSIPPLKPSTFATCDGWMKHMLAWDKARYEVDCEFRENLYFQYLIQGYAEYQLEVTDDEDE